MSKPLVKNAANESEIKYAETKSKLAQEKIDNDIKIVLSTDSGRSYIWKILSDCGIFKSSFTGSSETFFLEGKRSIGLNILADIMRIDPEAYLKMQMKQKGEY